MVLRRVVAALTASDWIIFGMPSCKKVYFVWLILAVTVTCPVRAQTESYFLDDYDFMASDQPNWVFTWSGLPEVTALPYARSYRQSSLQEAQCFPAFTAGVSESYQISPSVGNLGFGSVPEPATICILGMGLLVLIKLCRRRHPVVA